ncbi:MAG TPA: protein translocase subunit SecD [Pyrinomonadaceae bacterium]|jgi:preprotein translocase subunit SecD|nr:protein translocase subunit SecD [Pyrinomonadaceae bacterium]
MNKTNLWIRTGIIVAITLIGVYIVFGPREHVPTAQDFTWDGIKGNLAKNINLGLDLRGGSHLVMKVQVDEYLKRLTENDKEAALNAAKEAQLPVSDATSVTDNKSYSITINLTDPAKAQEVVEAVKKKVDLVNWTQSISGNTISWTLPTAQQQTLSKQAVDQAHKIIESRLNGTGVKEPTLQDYGSASNHQLLLQMPGVDDPERIKKLLNAEARLELMKVVGASNPQPRTGYPTEEAAKASLGGTVPANRRVIPVMERDDDETADKPKPDVAKVPKEWVVVESPAIIDGNELRDAQAVQNTGGNDYHIAFSLKPGGAQKFGDWTGKNVGAYMAVVLNDQVKSAPFIKSQIFDSGQIDGKFSKVSSDDLVLTLKSGALPAKISYQEERTIGPSLGADSIRSGVAASLGGLALVVVFMLVYYRGSGVNAVVALVLNMLLTIAALVMFGFTLTLPGIAGLILGIGMAVDSNVLIFERIREELRLGLTVPESVKVGFERAFITIIDTHITTIISSLILATSPSSQVRGFAITLILGLLINLFTAVFVSRTIFMWHLGGKRVVEKLSI